MPELPSLECPIACETAGFGVGSDDIINKGANKKPRLSGVDITHKSAEGRIGLKDNEDMPLTARDKLG